MKLKVSEAKLTGLFARDSAIIQVLIFKFAFVPKKVTGPLIETKDSNQIRIITNHFILFREVLVKNLSGELLKLRS